MRRGGSPSPLRRDTCRGLLEGYGVEDIAVRYGHHADDVRLVVKALRDAKMLGLMVKQARAAHAKAR